MCGVTSPMATMTDTTLALWKSAMDTMLSARAVYSPFLPLMQGPPRAMPLQLPSSETSTHAPQSSSSHSSEDEMTWNELKSQQLRFWNLVKDFIKDEDSILTDPDFARAVAERVRRAWSAKQHLVDPNE